MVPYSDDNRNGDIRGDDAVHLPHVHIQPPMLRLRLWASDRRPPDDHLHGKSQIILTPVVHSHKWGHWPFLTATQTSNPATPAPTPDVTVQMCSTCQTSVLSIAVRGYVPGSPCHNCETSLATAAASATAAETGPALAIQEHEVEVEAEAVAGPAGTNTPFSPLSTAPTTTTVAYVTAGTSRNVVHGGMVALFLGLFLALW